ncbi:mitochondrial carrier domain-containing protein [Hyaloraphidium curvatum]|nr:mitochondrial carrier domain-containing protein [Hyaloraphidium curvatum]
MAATTAAAPAPPIPASRHSFLRRLLTSHPDLIHTLSGAAAGVASSLVTNPLEVVKIRLQNRSTGGPPPSTWAALRAILAAEGIRGLYRGFPQTLMGYLPTWAIYFSAYERYKDAFAGLSGRPRDSSPVHIAAAGAAGATNTVVTNPIWVLRTRFIVQSAAALGSGPTPYRYTSTLDAVRTIWRDEGPAAFYKGLGASLLGTLHVVVMFPLYERLRRTFGAAMGGRPGEKDPAAAVLAASALSKMLASAVTYPHEVVRTRLHTHQPHPQPLPKPPPAHQAGKLTIRALLAQILHDEGWRGLYRGFGTNLVKTVPATMVTMLTYEGCRAWFEGVVRGD